MTEKAAAEVPFNLKKTEIVRWDKSDCVSKDEVYLSVEEPLAIELNGKKAAVLMRLPGSEKELAVGFCVSEGLVESFNDILLVHHCGSFEALHRAAVSEALEARNVVRVVTSKTSFPGSDDLTMLLVRSGCGRNNIAETGVELPYCGSKLKITARTLAKMSVLLCNQQKVKRLSGGLHSAVLFDREAQVVAGYEDVGRHNAMDKAIGHAMLHSLRLDDKILFTTGRTSYEMVTKAARVGIPVLVSLSSPTSLAVEYAQNCGITLVGYVRQSKMAVYSCLERIDFATIDRKDSEDRRSLAN